MKKIESILNNNKIQLIKGNLHLKNKFKKFPANTILKFPTKNYVLVNGMGTIQIFDENFSILQVINVTSQYTSFNFVLIGHELSP